MFDRRLVDLTLELCVIARDLATHTAHAAGPLLPVAGGLRPKQLNLENFAKYALYKLPNKLEGAKAMLRFVSVIVTSALIVGPSSLSMAQSGYVKNISAPGSGQKPEIPAVNLPKPGWEKVLDLQSSDGTASVPSCSEPDVISTVRDTIVLIMNDKYRAGGGSGDMLKKVDMEPVWVHPTFSNKHVCSTKIRFTILISNFVESWKFQTFSQDGLAKVFFFKSSG